MNNIELAAISTYLTEWPEHMSYQEILNCLLQDTSLEEDNIIIWRPCENYPPEELVQTIEDLRHGLERMFRK